MTARSARPAELGRSEIDLSVSVPPPAQSEGRGARAQKTKTLVSYSRYTSVTLAVHTVGVQQETHLGPI